MWKIKDKDQMIYFENGYTQMKISTNEIIRIAKKYDITIAGYLDYKGRN